jgi:hypothetical protein
MVRGRFVNLGSSAMAMVCVPKPRTCPAMRRYSLIRPPARGCLRARYRLEIGRLGQWFDRRGGVRGAVRPVLMMAGLVLARVPPQMGVVPGKGCDPGARDGMP